MLQLTSTGARLSAAQVRGSTPITSAQTRSPCAYRLSGMASSGGKHAKAPSFSLSRISPSRPSATTVASTISPSRARYDSAAAADTASLISSVNANASLRIWCRFECASKNASVSSISHSTVPPRRPSARMASVRWRR